MAIPDAMPTKILVIEDDEDMRTNLSVILNMEGFTVQVASDGDEGIRRAQKDRPDLILCDVMMPGMDGFSVLQALRADAQLNAVPFIFLTARGAREDLRTGMTLGADDYLTKPATRDELIAAIQSRMRRHRTLEESAVSKAELKPDFSSALPLELLGLTRREAEVLLWIAQGKSNGEVATILGMSEKTVKIHVGHIFEKLGTDNRHAAAVRALEILSSPKARQAAS
jgi:DNA-binding NarL/FixJ family response regulator